MQCIWEKQEINTKLLPGNLKRPFINYRYGWEKTSETNRSLIKQNMKVWNIGQAYTAGCGEGGIERGKFC
jgi:hypothetical protein